MTAEVPHGDLSQPGYCSEIGALIPTVDISSLRSPTLVIVHRFAKPGSDCLPGEEVAGIWLACQGKLIQLRLPLALRLLVDCLAKHRWIALSATQIEAVFRSDPFYRRHGLNAKTARKQTRRMNRTAIKTYMGRIREAFQCAIDEAGTDIKVYDIVASRSMLSKEVGYQLRASVRLVHLL
jgi:hypothetical protein